MNWRIKGIIQGMLARLPAGQAVNDRLQTIAGGRRDLREHVRSKVRGDWLVACSTLMEVGFTIDRARMLEIGTGWLPVFPLCFAIAGAEECLTGDLNAHLEMDVLPDLVKCLEDYLREISDVTSTPLSAVERRYELLRRCASGAEILREANIRYFAPFDAAETDLPPGCMNLVYSNSVLEHVTPEALKRLMRETHRLLAGSGLAIHGVNCGDHYAYFDKSISQLNYLKFSHSAWRKWNNDLQYQNRLRPVDFLDAATAAKLRVVRKMSRPKYHLLEALPESAVSSDFAHYSREDLCTTSVDFILSR